MRRADEATGFEGRSSAPARGVCLPAFLAMGAGLAAALGWVGASSGTQDVLQLTPAAVVAPVLLGIVCRLRRPSSRPPRGRIRGWAAAHLPTWLGWVLLLGGLLPLGLVAAYGVVLGILGLILGERTGALYLLTYTALGTPLWAVLLAMTVLGTSVVRGSEERRVARTRQPEEQPSSRP